MREILHFWPLLHLNFDVGTENGNFCNSQLQLVETVPYLIQQPKLFVELGSAHTLHTVCLEFWFVFLRFWIGFVATWWSTPHRERALAHVFPRARALGRLFISIKVCGCYLVTFLNWIPVFDWCMFRWGSKNKYHKDTCLTEIRLHLQNLLTTPHSIVFSYGINKYALQITITKSREVRFTI